ncbi:MAG: hypothetical protein R3D57_08045 [Hyphomicrobiaceae bacterium]
MRFRNFLWALAVAIAELSVIGQGRGGEADVIAAKATLLADGRWQVEATIRHDDAGWDHYADRFDVLAPDGTLLAERVLLHPHVEEQPFTRTTEPFAIPEGLAEVRVRAHDSVHETGGAEVTVALPVRPGE